MNDDFNNNGFHRDERSSNIGEPEKTEGEYHYTTPPYTNENGEKKQTDEWNYQNEKNQSDSAQSFSNQNNFNETPPSYNGYSQNNYQQYQNNRNQYNNPNNQFYNQYNNGQYNNYQNTEKKNNGKKIFIGIIIAVAVITVIVLLINSFGGKSSEKEEEKEIDSNVDSIVVEDSSDTPVSDATEVYNKVVKTNVGILVYENNSLYTEGSGVIAKEDNDGKYTYIITCAHVIEEGSDFIVQTYDGQKYEATVVGSDTRTDIGVLKIEANGLSIATFGDSSKLQVGQTVYAIGNPGGSEFSGSFTSGMISAIDRPISSSTGYEMECIQHDAAINPGNSGGALVNENGDVIGINSMKIASSSYEGMGFSVPTKVVTSVFDSIVANGYVTGRAKLGITYAPASNYQSYGMYVTVKGLPSGTIIIASISDDSSLKNTDAQVGDMITQVNGKDMTETGMLSEEIEDMSVGDKLTLTIVRVDSKSWTQKEFKIEVTLVEDKGTTTSTDEDSESNTPDNFSSDNSGSSGYDSYEDYFKQFFEDYGF